MIPVRLGDLPPAGTPFPVSPTQGRILELAARGLCDKEIARVLGIAFRTVRTHLERLYDESGERGRARCVVLWALAQADVAGEDRPALAAAS